MQAFLRLILFLHKKVANNLKNTLEQCGLIIKDVGTTYYADHAQANGNIAESSIDHVYIT